MHSGGRRRIGAYQDLRTQAREPGPLAGPGPSSFVPLPTARAYWRYPLYASGTGSDIPDVHPFWQILYDQGADVIVAGHAYRYERFDRIKPNPDPEKYGIPDSVTVSASSSSGPDVDMDSFVVLR